MKGKIICIDGGGDRIGKNTQAMMLKDYIESIGIMTKCVSFPNYGSPQAKPVEMYLAGDFPKLDIFETCMLYAFDRSVTMREKKLYDFLNDGGCLILDRYTPSNMVYQVASYYNDTEFHGCDTKTYDLAMQIEQMEYQILGLPVPDLVIYLDMDRAASKKLMDSCTDIMERDIHESNQKLLDRVAIIGKEIAKSNGWSIVKCNDDDRIFSPDEIHNEIINIIANFALERIHVPKE